MGDYTIVMRRSPHISNAERRRRLFAAYSLLLSLTEDKRTSNQREPTEPDQSVAGDASVPQHRRERDCEST
jgi:hypothetical protein